MIRICYSELHSGDRMFGEKEPFEDRSETHGLCNRCLQLELESIKRRKLELENINKRRKEEVEERRKVRKFKDCPNCTRKRSMLLGIDGWICLNCFKMIPYEEGGESDDFIDTRRER